MLLLAFAPGSMSPDSVAQLGEGRKHRFSDWNPPVMAWLWGGIDRVLPGPLGMLLLQAGALLAGVALLFSLHFRSTAAALLTLGVGLSPPVFGLLHVVWKDVQLGAAMTLAVALLAWLRRGAPWPAGVGALVCLTYAAAVRHNGPAAVVPVALWAGWIVRERWMPRSRRAAAPLLGLGLAAVAVASAMVWTAGLTARKRYPVQQVYMLDLAVLSRARGRLLFPDYILSNPTPYTVEELDRADIALYVGPLLWGTPPHRDMLTGDPARVRELRGRWMQEIAATPGAYLRHRWRLFHTLLGLRSDQPYPFHFGIEPNKLGVQAGDAPLQARARALLERLAPSPWFRAWVYLLGALGAALVLLRRRTRAAGAGVALAASAWTYALPYFVAAPQVDFRFVWWTVVAALLSVVLALAR